MNPSIPSIHPSTMTRIANTDVRVWILASIFYVTGDVLSTQAALTIGGGSEANPIARYVILNHGYLGLLAAKTLVFLIIIAVWMYAHHLVTLDEQGVLDTRIEAVLPTPLDTLHSMLSVDSRIPNTVFVAVIPVLPLVLGVYVTVNNVLVTTHETTLHEVAMSAVLFFA